MTHPHSPHPYYLIGYDGGRDHVPELAHSGVNVLHVDNVLLLCKGDGDSGLTLPGLGGILDAYHGDLPVVSCVVLCQVLQRNSQFPPSMIY